MTFLLLYLILALASLHNFKLVLHKAFLSKYSDGGKMVAQNADHGIPMSEGIAKNPLRKEIATLAKSLHEVGVTAESATA